MPKVSVAVIGVNGALGRPTIDALQSPPFKDKFAAPVLALTRDSTSKQSTNTIKYISADLAGNMDRLVRELRHIDVIVSLAKTTAESLAGTEQLVKQVKPKVYIPSRFGCDIAQASTVLPAFAARKEEHSRRLRDSGIKVVEISNSFFSGGAWLYEIVSHVGIDTGELSVTYLGSPRTRFSFTHLRDVGRVIASVASRAHDSLPNSVRVESGKLTPEDVAKRYEQTHRVTLTVKDIIGKEEVLREAQSSWDPSDYTRFTYWLNVLVSQGEDKGACFGTTDNELVNPGQTLWKWETF